MACSNVSWFNSALNPIVYVFLNPRFRREYIRLLKVLFGKTKAKFSHETSVEPGSAKSKSNTPKKYSVSNSTASLQQANKQILQQHQEDTKDTTVSEK